MRQGLEEQGQPGVGAIDAVEVEVAAGVAQGLGLGAVGGCRPAGDDEITGMSPAALMGPGAVEALPQGPGAEERQRDLRQRVAEAQVVAAVMVQGLFRCVVQRLLP